MSLAFEDKNLMGAIPSEVGKLQLQGLYLYGNKLQGNIPEGEVPHDIEGHCKTRSFCGYFILCDIIDGVSLDNNETKDERKFQRRGKGGSGSVYKGTLSSGTVVAIKVLDLQNDEVCKRFDTECEVMRNVRHKNLISVITTCSSEYIRAFVLQYIPNGSLENWLYREDCHLNLLQRVNIMLDVAVAIEYLHHSHYTPIVHCDLKPDNVLLDEEMVAHVGDFGIS
nr:receptor kinase-like protein Xa21 [Solanum lycopersicum]